MNQRKTNTLLFMAVIALVIMILLLIMSQAGRGNASTANSGSWGTSQGLADHLKGTPSSTENAETPSTNAPPVTPPATNEPPVTPPIFNQAQEPLLVKPTEIISFFGLRSVGTRIVYLVDSSGSMSGARFQKEKKELIRSLRTMGPQMQFAVIFYDDTPHYSIFLSLKLHPANKTNIENAVKWVQDMPIGGGNLVVSGFEVAVKFRPTTVFLLSDGMTDLNPNQVCADLKRLNSKTRTVINTVSLEDSRGKALMERIATDNGGRSIYIP